MKVECGWLAATYLAYVVFYQTMVWAGGIYVILSQHLSLYWLLGLLALNSLMLSPRSWSRVYRYPSEEGEEPEDL